VYLGQPTIVVFHHSKSPRSTTLDQIREWHTLPEPDGNGWSDIGYHYVIQEDERVRAAVPLHLIGRHAVPNAGRIGVCITGHNLEDGKHWSAGQIRAGIRLLHALELVFPSIDHCGHRDVAATECPGLDVRERFALFRMGGER
jgi:N-acetyl-anhydromuramyl-L-alanine amidase AmpD